MVHYTKQSLGQVVRQLRDSKGLTQEQLGRDAGYNAGAGVSISRLENGLVQPSAEKLAGIANALGLTCDELESRAAERSSQPDDASRAATDNVDTTPGQRELNARRKEVERTIAERAKTITDLSESFNSQHDQARDEFFMKFVEVADRVEGAPTVDASKLDDDATADASDAVAGQLRSNANGVVHALAAGAGSAAAGAAVGSAAAYGTFVAAASFGTASTGAAISALSGAAATNATLALLGGGTLAAGGAGVAGGSMVLAGIVAAPAALLFAGGLAWMARRNRRQRQEFAAQLDETEAELAATRPGIEALQDVLPRATEILDYIATHAGHALDRWKQQLGSDSMAWDSLEDTAKARYMDFIDVAAAQITLVMFNFGGLLVARDGELDEMVDLANEVLSQSREVVEARV